MLLVLLEHPGRVVSREELQQRLWPDGTFVDFEHSLNTAVKKLRDALGDVAENPRFIETVPLRGYRFTAPVEHRGGNGYPERSLRARRRPLWITVGAGVAVLTAAGALWWMSRPVLVPKLLGSTQLTHSGSVLAPDYFRESFPALVTDGSRIYFSELSGGVSRVVQVSAGGRDVLPIPMPFEGPAIVLHISPDGTKLLVRGGGSLWVVPMLGGRRLAGVTARDGAWSPDGQRIVLSRGTDLYLARGDGSDPRKLISTPGRAIWPRWSPDGTRLRFTLIDARTHARSLWEVSPEGAGLRPLLPSAPEGADACCGDWTPDGRHFVFRAHRDGRPDIWVISEYAGPLRGAHGVPSQLTTGPLHFRAAVPSRDGRRLFVVGAQPRRETAKYDLRAREFKPYESIPSAGLITFSPDGEWMAYVEYGAEPWTLWRSRIDGSQRLQLTAPPLWPMFTRWSPDGKRIAFMGKAPDKPWKIYVVAAEGGDAQPVLEGDRNEADPSWSPDGGSLMFGHPPDYMAEPNAKKAIYLVDLRTRNVSLLPGSEGLFSPRWSPDGRYVAAMPLDQAKVVLFDFATRNWSDLVRSDSNGGRPGYSSAHNPVWSRDGEVLYFQGFRDDGSSIYRVRMSERALEQVITQADVKRPVVGFILEALALDGSPVVGLSLPSSDIYALDWDTR